MQAAALVSAQPIQLIVPLDSAFRGRFVDHDESIGEITFTFSGSGRIRRIGDFGLSGAISLITLLPAGPAQGTLVLNGAAGTITVKLTAVAGGTAATRLLPVHYSYQITGGTGNYTNAVDHGTATLTAVFSRASGHTIGVQHGHFKLVMQSSFPEPDA